MNKHLFFALAASSLLFCACSGDNTIVGGETQGSTVPQQITLQVASSGDGLTTRAGRELLSSEADQDINEVKVFVCDNADKIVYVGDITNWKGTSTDYANGKQATLTIPEADRLNAGTYKIFAIGYSDESDYDLTSITNLAKDGTFKENAAISLKDGKTDAEEIFAGSANYTVEAGKEANGDVVLNRQVAGSYGYVCDIPYVEGATELQLVASTGNSNLILGSFANTDNAQPAETPLYVVNGDKAASNAQVIYTIDLTKWFTKIQDTNKDGIIDGDGNWISTDHKYYANGSAFAGKFIIPFAKKADSQTFTLRLVKPGSTTAEREWKVNLPTTDGQLSAHTFTSWNGTAFTTDAANTVDTKNVYSVVRNHLYGIGERLKADPTNPGTDPGDKPQSLKKKQDITLKVNDNWEVIHKMELE